MFRSLLNLICPPHCAVCGEPLALEVDDGISLCTPCRLSITTPDGGFCARCGGRKFQRLDETGDCRRCMTTPFRFRRVIALGEYEHELRMTILHMKTDRSGFSATAIAAWLVECRRKLLEDAADVVVPMPMHRLRRWQRGVNNPDFLAAEIARRLDRPLLRNVVQRTRRTGLQFQLTKRGRSENVKGAFVVVPRHQRLLTGKRVLLIDDILTTGATCNAVAAVLIAAGAKSVTVCVAARAEGNFIQLQNEPIVVK
jgi:ComF family protein